MQTFGVVGAAFLQWELCKGTQKRTAEKHAWLLQLLAALHNRPRRDRRTPGLGDARGDRRPRQRGGPARKPVCRSSRPIHHQAQVGWYHALIELQLSHAKRNKIAGIYDKSEKVAERRTMMQAWSDLIDKMKAD